MIIMFYSRKITTPKSTTRADAVRTKIKLTGGVITKIAVRFPAGPQFLLKIAISHGGHQVFPVNKSDSVMGEDEAIVTDEFYKLNKDQNVIDIETWNDDTAFAHDCIAMITVLPLWLASPKEGLGRVIYMLTLLLRRIGLKV